MTRATRDRRVRTGALAVLILLLTTAGCLATETPEARLSTSDGDGGVLVYLVLEDGDLVRSQAWWGNQAPELEVNVERTLPGWEALILKNDVTVDRGVVLGTQDRAYVVWRSADAGVTAQPGDTFEVLVVDHGEDRTAASYSLAIET